jgi:hypothetical protein
MIITGFLPKQQPETEPRSVHISYFLQKCKKDKPCGMDLPLLKNDITGSEPISKLGIHSRNMQFSPKNWDG